MVPVTQKVKELSSKMKRRSNKQLWERVPHNFGNFLSAISSPRCGYKKRVDPYPLLFCQKICTVSPISIEYYGKLIDRYEISFYNRHFTKLYDVNVVRQVK